jgi:hypothetical protein
MFFIMLNEDSTMVDSMPVYEVPEIIDFYLYDEETRPMLCLGQEYVPALHDLSLTDILRFSPLNISHFGYGQLNVITFPGHGFFHGKLFVNNHPITNILAGYMDYSLCLPFFFQNTYVHSSPYQGETINLNTKCNKYDRPYSAMRYSTGDFGTSLYNLDFTRAITNNFGFYVNGVYWKSQGYMGQPHEITSAYTQIYTSKAFPLRFDGFYLNNDNTYVVGTNDTLPIHKETTFLNASLMSGSDYHKIAFRLSTHTQHLSAQYFTDDHKHTTNCYGIDIANCHTISDARIMYHLSGDFNTLTSTIYGDIDSPRLALGCCIDRNLGNFCITAAGSGEYILPRALFLSPYCRFGFFLSDSTGAMFSLSRRYRAPAISETLVVSEWYEPRYPIMAYENLQPEYYWSQRMELQHKKSRLALYKYDYSNLITVNTDTDPFSYTNIDVYHVVGVEGNLTVIAPLQSNADQTSATALRLHCGGNYVLNGDRIPLIAQRNGYLALELRRDTERFAGSVMCRGEYIGSRVDINGYELDNLTRLSALVTLRFVTLTFGLRIDNLLDDTLYIASDYPSPPRNIIFSVRWEFFN